MRLSPTAPQAEVCLPRQRTQFSSNIASPTSSQTQQQSITVFWVPPSCPVNNWPRRLSGKVKFSTSFQTCYCSLTSERSPTGGARNASNQSIRTGPVNSIRPLAAARISSLAHYGSIIGIVGRRNNNPVR